jgi:hypothetical protein
MSIFRYLFDSDWMQRADLERLDQQTNRIHSDLWSQSRENRNLAEENEALRQEVSKLVLVVESMNRLALRKNVWTAEEMAQTLGAADLEDGVADGKRTNAARPVKTACGGCGRPIPSQVARCPHCNRRRPE